jgi:hypothetical protein
MSKKMTKEQMVRRYWAIKVHGKVEAKIEGAEIDPDGRTRKTTVKEWIAEGVITAGEKTPYTDWYIGTETLGDLVRAERPDIVAMSTLAESRHPNDVVNCKGAWMERLSTENLRFIAANVKEYTFFTSHNREVPNTSFEAYYVKDAAFFQAAADKDKELRIEAATKSNLVWGLRTSGIAEEAKVDMKEDGKTYFDTRGDGVSSPFGGRSHLFGSDPDKWGQNSDEIRASLLRRIADDMKHVKALEAVDFIIAKRGGWDTFVADYKKRIREGIEKAIAEEKTIEAPKAAGGVK